MLGIDKTVLIKCDVELVLCLILINRKIKDFNFSYIGRAKIIIVYIF